MGYVRKCFRCRRCANELKSLWGYNYCDGCNWDSAETSLIKIKDLNLIKQRKAMLAMLKPF